MSNYRETDDFTDLMVDGHHVSIEEYLEHRDKLVSIYEDIEWDDLEEGVE